MYGYVFLSSYSIIVHKLSFIDITIDVVAIMSFTYLLKIMSEQFIFVRTSSVFT